MDQAQAPRRSSTDDGPDRDGSQRGLSVASSGLVSELGPAVGSALHAADVVRAQLVGVEREHVRLEGERREEREVVDDAATPRLEPQIGVDLAVEDLLAASSPAERPGAEARTRRDERS